jgi:4-amino-4-deoxy-L-arabinose transferase-like glycosyltransferase
MTGRWFESKRNALAVVFLVALAIRLAFLFVVLPLAPRLVPGLSTSPGMTFDGYHDIAQQLLEGHGFALPEHGGATAARAPLYPFFLATVYRLFGTQIPVVLALHALIGALTCVVVLLLGRELYGPVAGLIAGLVFCVMPLQLWWSQYVLSETMLTFLLTAAVFALVRFGRRRDPASAVTAGLLIGIAALCNSVILPFPLLLLAATIVLGRRMRLPSWRGALLVAFASAAVVLPWTTRNALRFHALIPVSWGYGLQSFKSWAWADRLSAGGWDNLAGLDDDADMKVLSALEAHGLVRGAATDKFAEYRHTMTLPRDEDALLARLAVERARRDPAGAFRRMPMNLWFFWTLSIRPMTPILVFDLTLLALALVGIAATARGDPVRWLPLAFAGYLYLAYASIIATSRFSLQVMPEVTVFASAGIVWLWTKWTRRPRPAAAGTTSGA